MPKPNRDRVRVSVWVARSGVTAIQGLAQRREEPVSETYRTLLRYAMQHMPPNWTMAPWPPDPRETEPIRGRTTSPPAAGRKYRNRADGTFELDPKGLR